MFIIYKIKQISHNKKKKLEIKLITTINCEI